MNDVSPVKTSDGTEPLCSTSGFVAWFADRPWLFVTGAFLVLISVWVIFFTLALKNPVRDVLKDPLPTAPATATSDESATH